MAKRRTGLQSNIAGIFSGVPVPKKGGSRSKSDSSAPKSDEPTKKPAGSVTPAPATVQPVTPDTPAPKKQDKPLPVAPQPKVVEVEAPGRMTRQLPKKMPRRKRKTSTSKTGVSSTRQKTGIIMFVVFTTALVVVLAKPYLKSSRTIPGTRTPRQANAKISPTANIEINWQVPPVYPSKLRDPMELASKQITEPQTPYDIVIKGITYSEDRKFVVIGTQTLQEGDTVLGAKIIQINPSSVVFERDGERFTKYVKN